jgi:hypothetical protein
VTTPRDADDWESVESLDDFAAYLKVLSDDFEASQPDPWGERWAYGSVGDFLEAFSASIRDHYLDEGAPSAGNRPEPSWRSFAQLLSTARVYE